MWGLLACWHRWRAYRLRRLAHLGQSRAEALIDKARKAHFAALIAEANAAGAPDWKARCRRHWRDLRRHHPRGIP